MNEPCQVCGRVEFNEVTALNHSALLKAAHDLAPLPPAFVQLSALVSTGEYSPADVEAIVRLDAPLTGRLLQYANSAASPGYMRIGTVREAVMRVGVGPVLSIMAATTLRPELLRAVPAYGLSEGDLWRHSVATALACEVIAQKAPVSVPPDSFTASLLHDVGKIVIARFLDRNSQGQLAAARASGGQSSLQAENDILGAHHGEIGGLIGSHWNLPPRVVSSITHHHAPAVGDDVICDVVHVANVLAKRIGAGYVATASDLDADPDALERLGLATGRLPQLLDTVTQRLAETIERFG